MTTVFLTILVCTTESFKNYSLAKFAVHIETNSDQIVLLYVHRPFAHIKLIFYI